MNYGICLMSHFHLSLIFEGKAGNLPLKRKLKSLLYLRRRGAYLRGLHIRDYNIRYDPALIFKH